jgi:hypothetical protein
VTATMTVTASVTATTAVTAAAAATATAAVTATMTMAALKLKTETVSEQQLGRVTLLPYRCGASTTHTLKNTTHF